MTQAAILIQSKFRSYYEQKKFQQSRRAAMLIQQYYRSYKECGKRKQNRRAATIVQQKLRWAVGVLDATRILLHCVYTHQGCAVIHRTEASGKRAVVHRIIVLAFSVILSSFACTSVLGVLCLEAVCLPRSRIKLLARLCGFYDAAATGMTLSFGICPSLEQCNNIQVCQQWMQYKG